MITGQLTSHSDTQHHYVSSSTTQTMYIVNQLVANNNQLLTKQDILTQENLHFREQVQQLTEETQRQQHLLHHIETENSKMKRLIAQASQTITQTEEDYFTLQRQVEILTKKMQLVMYENKRLSAMMSTSAPPPSSSTLQGQRSMPGQGQVHGQGQVQQGRSSQDDKAIRFSDAIGQRMSPMDEPLYY